MPNRVLRPWTDSEAVNSLSDAGEVFFVRLIQMADDFGRFHGSPMLLKAYLFPLKDKRIADITRLIAECVTAGLIAVYEVSGKRYLQIRKFDQRTRAIKSKFPDPPENAEPPKADCPSNDGHLTDGCPAGDSGRRRRETETNNPPAGDTAPANDPYPHSVAEVIELSKLPWCGMSCSREQAEAYFTDRLARDWIPYGQNRQLRTQVQICADLKKWLMRDLNELKERERQGKNGDNRNNFRGKYDSKDDGSNY